MKEDYLWDKTGSDPGIEELENALRAFRYQETAPPALPAKAIVSEKKSWRHFFRLAFPAFAATGLLIAFGLIFWSQFSSKKIEVAAVTTQTNVSQVEEKASIVAPLEQPKDLTFRKIELPKQKQKIAPKFVKAKKIIPATARLDKNIARKIETKSPAVRLTKDEKYAYDQLMLALSITGSKLKLVKDKVDGTEEKTAVLENAR